MVMTEVKFGYGTLSAVCISNTTTKWATFCSKIQYQNGPMVRREKRFDEGISLFSQKSIATLGENDFHSVRNC